MFLSSNNSLKIIAPLSFDNVVCDYQYRLKNITKGSLRISLYLGIGTDLSLSGNGNNNKDKGGKDDKNNKNGGQFATALRVPLGVEVRYSNYPLDLFAEIAPSLQIFNGSDVEVDPANIDWKKIGFGARYYF